MSGDSYLVTVSQETAKVFSLKQVRKDGSIDLKKLAGAAQKAIEGSERSLKAAGDIADGNWFLRLWNSPEFAKNIVASIGHIRDISQVNLALSAICNDLAAANLQHAQKIDANHYATSRQLHDVQQLTRGLLEHLQTARNSALLQPIAAGLGAVDGTDKEALQGWLHSFAEAIDLQYVALQDKFNQLAQQAVVAPEVVERLQAELDRLDADLQNQKTKNARQLGKIDTRLTDQMALAAQNSRAFDATLRKSHDKLGEGLKQLNAHLNAVKRSLVKEQETREAFSASVLQSLEHRDQTLRRTIHALNQHWLKRLFWVSGILLLLQIGVFVYLAGRTGLW